MLETTPSVTMMAVMVRGGAICTIFRTRASIRPDLSATPMPIMATRMIPTGPKFMKLATTEVQIKRIPSADNRPWTFVVMSSTSWVCGLIRRYVALVPSHCSTCESNTKIAVRRENSTAGCGTAFPTRSTVSSVRFISVWVAPLDPLMIRSVRSLVGGAFGGRTPDGRELGWRAAGLGRRNPLPIFFVHRLAVATSVRQAADEEKAAGTVLSDHEEERMVGT